MKSLYIYVRMCIYVLREGRRVVTRYFISIVFFRLLITSLVLLSSNRPMLTAALQALGYDVEDLGIARDNPDTIRAALVRGMRCDIVITSGGVSMGEKHSVWQ